MSPPPGVQHDISISVNQENGVLENYFEKVVNRPLTEAEIAECTLSLFYLGRAIYKYNLLKQGGNK